MSQDVTQELCDGKTAPCIPTGPTSVPQVLSSNQRQTLGTVIFQVPAGGDLELELLTSFGLYPERK